MTDSYRDKLRDTCHALLDKISELPPNDPRRQRYANTIDDIDVVLKETETDPVIFLMYQIDEMPAEDRKKILEASNWEGRWRFIEMMLLAADKHGMGDAEKDELTLFSKALAWWLVDELGRPEITNPCQARIYMLHGDERVRADAAEWQRRHPEEMRLFIEMNEAEKATLH